MFGPRGDEWWQTWQHTEDVRAVLDRNVHLENENEALRELLRRLAEWDHMQTAGDGPFWLSEIAKVLHSGEEERP